MPLSKLLLIRTACRPTTPEKAAVLGAASEPEANSTDVSARVESTFANRSRSLASSELNSFRGKTMSLTSVALMIPINTSEKRETAMSKTSSGRSMTGSATMQSV